MGIAMIIGGSVRQVIQNEKIWYDEKLSRNDLDLKKIIMCRLLLGNMLISIGCSKVEPGTSKAGVMIILRCAKYSE